MAANNVMESVVNFLQKTDWQDALAKKGSILKSNEAINAFPKGGLNTKGMMTGLPRTISNVRHGGMKLMDAAKAAHSTVDGLDATTIAGSYMGVSAAHRVLTGGGLTKDSKGNSNLIGVPFV